MAGTSNVSKGWADCIVLQEDPLRATFRPQARSSAPAAEWSALRGRPLSDRARRDPLRWALRQTGLLLLALQALADSGQTVRWDRICGSVCQQCCDRRSCRKSCELCESLFSHVFCFMPVASGAVEHPLSQQLWPMRFTLCPRKTR